MPRKSLRKFYIALEKKEGGWKVHDIVWPGEDPRQMPVFTGPNIHVITVPYPEDREGELRFLQLLPIFDKLYNEHSAGLALGYLLEQVINTKPVPAVQL